MLAGLCNLCDDFGHSNFDAMRFIAHSVSQVETTTVDCHGVVKSLRAYQTFLKQSWQNHLKGIPHAKNCA